MSGKTIPSAYPHWILHKQVATPHTRHKLQPLKKQKINRDLRQRKIAAQRGKHGRAALLEKNVLNLDLNEAREGFFWRGRGRSFHVQGPKMEKANSGKSGTRNLEAESIRNRAESIRRCVELRTVTDIRQSSA